MSLLLRLRKSGKRIHAMIAAAKLRRLRNELVWRGGLAPRPSIVSDATHRPRIPLLLDEKWDR